MIKRHLKLDIRQPEGLKGDAYWKADKKLNAALKRVPKSYGDVRLDLDHPKLAEHVEIIRDALQHKLGRVTSATLQEEFVETPDAPADWYVLDPAHDLDDEGTTPEKLSYVVADRIPKSVHVASIWTPPLVSEKFKKFVESKKLRGLDFVRLPDKGKTRAMKWFMPIALKPLGRGLHHEGLVPSKVHPRNIPTDPKWRHGHPWATDYAMRKGYRLGSPIAEPLLPKGKFSAGRNQRFLREFVPKGVDFAFIWDRQDEFQVSGFFYCARKLCVSRRAKEALVKAKLVTEKEFKPIEILDAPPPGVKPLDKPGDKLPGPLFEGEWRERINAREKELFNGAKPKAKSKKPRALADVLLRLKKISTAGGAKNVDASVPRSWRDVLAVADGFTTPPADALDEATASFAPARSLANMQKRLTKEYDHLFAAPPKDLLLIGETLYGDLILLRTGKKSAADAPAILWSHEDARETHRWPTALAMLDELLGES